MWEEARGLDVELQRFVICYWIFQEKVVDYMTNLCNFAKFCVRNYRIFEHSATLEINHEIHYREKCLYQ